MGIQYIQKLSEDKKYFVHTEAFGSSSSQVREFNTIEEAVIHVAAYMKENPSIKLDDFPQNTDKNDEYLFSFGHGLDCNENKAILLFGVRYPNLADTYYPSIVASILSRDDWNNLATNHQNVVLDV